MSISGQYILPIATTLFHLIMSWREKRSILPPGKLIDTRDRQIHLWVKGTGTTTVILDSSLVSLISSNYTEIIATFSSHFVWIDEPEIIVKTIVLLL